VQLPEPAGSQATLPDDLPSLRWQTLVSGRFHVVDGGDTRGADIVSALRTF
jgi:hypothetical protein